MNFDWNDCWNHYYNDYVECYVNVMNILSERCRWFIDWVIWPIFEMRVEFFCSVSHISFIYLSLFSFYLIFISFSTLFFLRNILCLKYSTFTYWNILFVAWIRNAFKLISNRINVAIDLSFFLSFFLLLNLSLSFSPCSIFCDFLFLFQFLCHLFTYSYD